MPVTLNVYVKDANTGVGVGTARVIGMTKNQIIDPPCRQVSGDGGCNLYFNGPEFDPAVEVSLAVDAPGYAPWSTNDKPIMFGKSNVDFVVELQPSFSRPGRDRLIAVQEHFQGLTLPKGPLGNPVPMFGPFCYGLDAQGRRDWRTVERNAKDNSATRCLSVNYNDGDFSYSGQYGIPGTDFTQNLLGLKQLLAEDILSGIFPTLYLAGDGTSYTPDGGTYGYQWLMDNMERVVAALRDKSVLGFDFSDLGRWVLGFELITDGGWNPDMFESGTLKLRPLIGDNGVMCSHIGTYTWWGDGSGKPSGGPVGDWASPTGLAIDVSFEEGDDPFVDASGNPLNNEQSDGWEQRASARFGPNATNIQPRNQIVWEWPQQPPSTMTPRGVRTTVAKELDLYRWVRNRVSLSELELERKWVRSLAFQYIG